jgi:hypothetical protein
MKVKRARCGGRVPALRGSAHLAGDCFRNLSAPNRTTASAPRHRAGPLGLEPCRTIGIARGVRMGSALARLPIVGQQQ